MKTIPLSVIEQIWARHCELDEDESRKMMAQFTAEQPFVTAYLVVADETLGPEAPDSQLIPLVALAWEAFRQEGSRLKTVKPRAIERAESINMRFLEKLEADSEMAKVDAAHRLLESYNQRTLLQFALEVLMAGNEETPEMASENVGIELLHLKTVIDCLDQ